MFGVGLSWVWLGLFVGLARAFRVWLGSFVGFGGGFRGFG